MEYLSRRAAEWDRFASRADPAWAYPLLGVGLAIALFALYEILALGIEAIIQRLGASRGG